MRKAYNRLINAKVIVCYNDICSAPHEYVFEKEGHVLAVSSTLQSLYNEVLRLGYDICDSSKVQTEFKYTCGASIKSFISKEIVSDKVDAMMRKYNFEHKESAE